MNHPYIEDPFPGEALPDVISTPGFLIHKRPVEERVTPIEVGAVLLGETVTALGNEQPTRLAGLLEQIKQGATTGIEAVAAQWLSPESRALLRAALYPKRTTEVSLLGFYYSEIGALPNRVKPDFDFIERIRDIASKSGAMVSSVS